MNSSLGVFAGLALLTFSCKQDTGGIGANVLPTQNIYGTKYNDTTTILASLFLNDSLPTSGTTPLLGSYTDPIFGLTKASIYTQILWPQILPYIDIVTSNCYSCYIKFDSAVLILPVAGYYGSLGPQEICVDTFLGNNSIPVGFSDSNYYSNATKLYSSSPFSVPYVTKPNFVEKFVNPAYNDTIRIILPKKWGSTILANASYYAVPGNNSIFTNWFKGFYITTSNSLQLPGQGGILYINPAGAVINFYYNDLNPTFNNPDSLLSVQFVVGGSGNGIIYYTHFTHDYTISPFNIHPNGKHDSVKASQYLYLQAMAGVTPKLIIPGIMNWVKKGPIIVNKAEIDFTVNTNDGGTYLPPSQLLLLGVASNDSAYLLPDYLSNPSTYGGVLTFNSTSTYYSFTITEYIQEVLTGKIIDHGFYLLPYNPSITANRVVLYGPNNITYPLKFKLYYTPLYSN
jgi:hypothetical protein